MMLHVAMYLDGQTLWFGMFYYELKTGWAFDICGRFHAFSFVCISVYYYATGLCAFCLMCCWIRSCGKWWIKHWSVFLIILDWQQCFSKLIPLSQFLILWYFIIVDSYEPYYIVLLFTPCMFGHCPHLQTSLYVLFFYVHPLILFTNYWMKAMMNHENYIRMSDFRDALALMRRCFMFWAVSMSLLSSVFLWVTGFVFNTNISAYLLCLSLMAHFLSIGTWLLLVSLLEFALHLNTFVACLHCWRSSDEQLTARTIWLELFPYDSKIFKSLMIPSLSLCVIFGEALY